MSGEEEAVVLDSSSSSAVDSPTNVMLSDFFSNNNIDPDDFSSLEQRYISFPFTIPPQQEEYLYTTSPSTLWNFPDFPKFADTPAADAPAPDVYVNSLSTPICPSSLPEIEFSRSTLEGISKCPSCQRNEVTMQQHVKDTKSSTNEKLDLRLNCIEISQTATSPPQPQASQNGLKVPIESLAPGTEPGILYKGEQERKDTGGSGKRKYRKKNEPVGLEILKQHFGQSLVEAAKSLNVSRSTLKHICRKHGISEWPSCQRNKVRAEGQSVQNAGANNPILATSPSILPTVVIPCQPNSPGSKISERQGKKSKSYKTQVGFRQFERQDHVPWGNEFHEQTNPARGMPNVTAEQDASTLTVKATYRGDTIRFLFPLTSGFIELKNRIAKRLMLKVSTFSIKYEDEHHDLIVVWCDEDLQECIRVSKSLGSNVVRLLVHDKQEILHPPLPLYFTP